MNKFSWNWVMHDDLCHYFYVWSFIFLGATVMAYVGDVQFELFARSVSVTVGMFVGSIAGNRIGFSG